MTNRTWYNSPAERHHRSPAACHHLHFVTAAVPAARKLPFRGALPVPEQCPRPAGCWQAPLPAQPRFRPQEQPARLPDAIKRLTPARGGESSEERGQETGGTQPREAARSGPSSAGAPAVPPAAPEAPGAEGSEQPTGSRGRAGPGERPRVPAPEAGPGRGGACAGPGGPGRGRPRGGFPRPARQPSRRPSLPGSLRAPPPPPGPGPPAPLPPGPAAGLELPSSRGPGGVTRPGATPPLPAPPLTSASRSPFALLSAAGRRGDRRGGGSPSPGAGGRQRHPWRSARLSSGGGGRRRPRRGPGGGAGAGARAGAGAGAGRAAAGGAAGAGPAPPRPPGWAVPRRAAAGHGRPPPPAAAAGAPRGCPPPARARPRPAGPPGLPLPRRDCLVPHHHLFSVSQLQNICIRAIFFLVNFVNFIKTYC